MSRHIHPKLPAALKALSKRLEAFRSHRMRQRNLPEALWEQAVEQALQHGIFRVHQALRLNYNGLKRRVAEFPLPAKKTPSAFIELQAPSVSLVGHDVILGVLPASMYRGDIF